MAFAPGQTGIRSRKGVSPAGAPFTRYHAVGSKEMDMEAGFPLQKPIDGNERIRPAKLPGGKVAITWHVGPYHTLGQTHTRLKKWIGGHGYATTAPCWEVYWTDPGLEQNPQRWRMKCCGPFGQRESRRRKARRTARSSGESRPLSPALEHGPCMQTECAQQREVVQLTQDVVRRHQRGVWRYLRFLGCSPELADDLTQEPFLTLLQWAPDERRDAALAAWLRTTARNLFRMHVRRPRPGVDLAAETDVEQAWQRLAGPDPAQAGSD